MEKKDKHRIDRREFLKRLGAGVTAVSATTVAGCSFRDAGTGGRARGEVPTDKMTYRTAPKTKEQISLLGYGCMRWPMMPSLDGTGEVIDQEAVNGLVDYALAHGVNYFDTAPPYCRGLSEKATGTALKRHPRNSYYLATKMSNHRLAGQGLSPEELFDASVKMYRRSFEDLQTDYFDYYLLHIVGIGSGMPFLMERFFDNGLLDFLLKEREAGRIRHLGFSYHGDVKVFDYLLSRHDEFKWDFVQIQLNYVDYRHASGMNFNAEYLYAELEKRDIPTIVMEPLLGGRLTTLTNYLNGRLKQRRPEESIASWAFRFAGSFPKVLTVLSGMTYMEHFAGQYPYFLAARSLYGRGVGTLGRYGADHAEIPVGSLYRLPILYALSIRTGHSCHIRTLQQVHQRRECSRLFAGRELSESPTGVSRRLRPFRAETAAGRPLHRLRPMRTPLPAKHQYPGTNAANQLLCGTT